MKTQYKATEIKMAWYRCKKKRKGQGNKRTTSETNLDTDYMGT